MRFEKWEGLGNDFIVLRADADDLVDAATVRALCDRRFGVGADGVLLVLPPRDPKAVARMRVLNADGSVPEMCGNGLRCVVFHVAHSGGGEGPFTVDTDAGLRVCTLVAPHDADDAGGAPRVRVDMGPITLGPREPIAVGDDPPLTYRLADAGNPHAITFGTFDRDLIGRVGPAIATHARFPRGTNVAFATVGPDGIELTVWERGVGLTLACGTGACATVAAACRDGLWPEGAPADVRLPGGLLRITIDPRGHALMEGPARRVFTGEWPGLPAGRG